MWRRFALLQAVCPLRLLHPISMHEADTGSNTGEGPGKRMRFFCSGCYRGAGCSAQRKPFQRVRAVDRHNGDADVAQRIGCARRV